MDRARPALAHAVLRETSSLDSPTPDDGLDAPSGRPARELATSLGDHDGTSTYSRAFVNSLFAIYLLIGLGLIALTPPFQSADAFAHFDREVGIARGQLIASTHHGSSGSDLPIGVLWLEDEFSTLPFNSFSRVSASQFRIGNEFDWNTPPTFVKYTTGGNIPFLYLPQVLGVEIGRLLSPRILVSYYLAEVMNLLAFLGLARWAFSRLPRRLAIPLGVFLLLPLMTSIAISVNPDCLLMALSTVLATACYRAYTAYREDVAASGVSPRDEEARAASRAAMSRWYYVGFASLFFMTLDKPPLILLGLLLPLVDLYSNLRRYVIRVLTFIASAGIVYELWSRFGARGAGGPIPASTFAPARQLRLMVTDPLKDTEVLATTLWRSGWIFWEQLVAGIGWLDVFFPRWVYTSLTVLVVASIFSIVPRSTLGTWRLVWSLAVLILTALGTSFSLYVFYSSYGATTINGLQGRYYLPLIPMLIVVLGIQTTHSPLSRRFANVVGEYGGTALISFQILVATEYAVTLLQRYWYH